MALQRVALIGSTGLVGQEFQKIFHLDSASKNFEMHCFASRERPEEKVFAFTKLLEEASSYRFFINAADADQARQIASKLKSPQVLIDNSSAFRMTQGVPLVVPEINKEQLKKDPRIVANPNCTAALLCMALEPLKKWELERVVVSTYQAASGAGLKGLEELEKQIHTWEQDRTQKLHAEVFPFPLFLNVMSHNTAIRQDSEGRGYNDEEWKVIQETRKILDLATLKISATCMRVPVLRAHTESVTVDLKLPFELSEIEAALKSFSGVRWQNDETKNHFPMPYDSQNKDEVYVGRLRRDPFLPQTLHLILSGDQLRKGAALNAYQILKAFQ